MDCDVLDAERLARAMEAYCREWYIDLDKGRDHATFLADAEGIAAEYARLGEDVGGHPTPPTR